MQSGKGDMDLKLGLLTGDCLEVLSRLPENSVHCVVTSPPYWGLRDYKIPSSVWGGDPKCQHVWGEPQRPGNYNWGEYIVADGKLDKGHQKEANAQRSAFCKQCSAWRGTYGLEPTIPLYLAHTVEIFRAVRRVLRPDGTLWLNIGDSYATGTSSNRKPTQTGEHGYWENPNISQRINGASSGLKPKDLCGIPWRVAFALQEDGWYLRQDIIWSKRNYMPESVTDRCSKSHEYIFLLTKNSKYFYDAEAIKEKAVSNHLPGNKAHKHVGQYVNGRTVHEAERAAQGFRLRERFVGERVAMRNKRSVWELTTQAFSDAHFATFPYKLVEPCIKAGTSAKGCCAKCGAPWKRKTTRIDKGFDGSRYGERVVAASGGAVTGGTAKSTLGSGNGKLVGGRETVGWSPSCKCKANVVPCIVLDPFGGAGSTAIVAARLRRNALLIEIGEKYVKMARKRIVNTLGLLKPIITEDFKWVKVVGAAEAAHTLEKTSAARWKAKPSAIPRSRQSRPEAPSAKS